MPSLTRSGRGSPQLPLLLLALVLSAAAACRAEPEPIVVAPDRISVFNRTNEDWTSVRLTLNRYYVAEVPRLGARGRFDAPLERFQGGFGRYFDRKRERPRSVELTATAADGTPVKLGWKEGQR
jgi:hypothetical protein